MFANSTTVLSESSGEMIPVLIRCTVQMFGSSVREREGGGGEGEQSRGYSLS